MDLSVVVPTLNAREQLAGCLDALSEHAPDAEVVVVNGPSSDGTTGMVRERSDVDVLVEVSDRNTNVARNAGIEVAEGDVLAFLSTEFIVTPTWFDTVARATADGADVVTGPTQRTLRAGITTEREEQRRVAGRAVTFFNGDNAAFDREVIDALDGFDEYLSTGGARDASHRLAALDYEVRWDADMSVRGEYGADGGMIDEDLAQRYRMMTYRLAKNYGLRPAAASTTVPRALRDASATVRTLAGGDRSLTSCLADCRGVLSGIARGYKDGIAARRRDGAPRRNPHGVSTRHDRAVRRYEWRS